MFLALLATGASTVPTARTLAACGHANEAIPSANVNRADALFKEARRLIEASKIDQDPRKINEACEKFAESQCLDPAPGTLLNLGACHAKQKKFGSAWGELTEAKNISEREGNAAREQLARQELKALEPRVSRVTISVPTGLRKPGLEIKLDDKVVEPTAFGQAMPADPGLHRVVAVLPGASPWQSTFTFGERAEQKVVEIGPLTFPPVGEKKLVPEKKPEALVEVSDPVKVDEGQHLSNLRRASYVVMGAGGAAVVVGSYFGLRTFAKTKERNENCPVGDDGQEHCNSTAVAAYQSGSSSALAANLTFGLGLAALGAGGLMWFLSRSSETTHEQQLASLQVLASARGAGLAFSQQW